MHNRFQSRLNLPLTPSPRLLGALRALHGVAATMVVLALPWSWQIVPSLVLLAVSAVVTRRELLAAARRYHALELTAHGHWYCLGSTGERQPARLAGHPFMMGRLVILPIAAGGGRYTVALDAASTQADELRRLKVRLRLDSGVTAAAS